MSARSGAAAPDANRSRRAFGVAMALAGLSWVKAARSGTDARPLTLIVPQAAGGAADHFGRLIGKGMEPLLGRPVLVDNRAGGGSIVGTLAIANAPPDGSTIGMVFSAFAINQALRRHMPYDALSDFAPLCLGGYNILVLVAATGHAADDAGQLIAQARRASVPTLYGSLGVGSAAHIAGELLAIEADIELQHVPYNGSAHIYREILAGDLPFGIVTLASALPYLRARKLTVLGTTNARRSSRYPALPAVAEFLPGFELLGFFGFVAPARTPAAIIEQQADALRKALRSREAAPQFAELGAEILVSTPNGFASFLRAEVERFTALSRRTGLRLD